MHRKLQNLFERGGLLFRKWNSSEATVLDHIDHSLCDQDFQHTFSEVEYTMTLGVEEHVQWDEPVPDFLHQMWLQWRSMLPLIMEKLILHCYYPKDIHVAFKQLHSFSDASEQAYSGVVYLHMVDTTGRVHTSLIIVKTKVAPIKTRAMWSSAPHTLTSSLPMAPSSCIGEALLAAMVSRILN